MTWVSSGYECWFELEWAICETPLFYVFEPSRPGKWFFFLIIIAECRCPPSAAETPCTSWLLCKDHFCCAVQEKPSWFLYGLSDFVWQKATGTFANSLCTGNSLQQGPSYPAGERALFYRVASITCDLIVFFASGCNPDLHWCCIIIFFFSKNRIYFSTQNVQLVG